MDRCLSGSTAAVSGFGSAHPLVHVALPSPPDQYGPKTAGPSRRTVVCSLVYSANFGSFDTGSERISEDSVGLRRRSDSGPGKRLAPGSVCCSHRDARSTVYKRRALRPAV
ncbi:unnamed protein product [Ixodes pacificus]